MTRDEFAGEVLGAETMLYRISHSILRNDDDCCDAVQEAITAALTKLHTLRQDAYFKTWLCRILIRECYQILRKQERLVPIEEYLLPSYPGPEQADNSVYDAIMQLNPKLRIVTVLHYVEGFSVEETAKILQIPGGTVKSRLSLSREKIKQILGTQEGVKDALG